MERLQSVLVALLQLIARAIVKKINLHALSGCHKTDNYRLSECNFRCADDTNCISQCARGLASCQGSADRQSRDHENFQNLDRIGEKNRDIPDQFADQAVRRSLPLALNTVLVTKNVRMDVHVATIIPITAMMLVCLITMIWITTSVAMPMTSVQ